MEEGGKYRLVKKPNTNCCVLGQASVTTRSGAIYPYASSVKHVQGKKRKLRRQKRLPLQHSRKRSHIGSEEP
eukprot:1153692-Pelagomonas_calceolata.AAC.4